MEKKTYTSTEGLLEAGKLNELRKLLIGLSQEELNRLQNLLNDPHEFAEELSTLLPYAIRKMIEKGELTVDTLLPFVEDAMHKSIQKNPQRLADILFPVMGPAIRKAVAEDLKRMVAAINASLETGFSPKTIKWRLQALISKRTFTEIVLANSYVYHVSHVFLIHRETGLLLREELAPESQPLESDLISSMLTAIRDFAHDSFKSATPGSLDEIQVGELKILVEQGPFAIIAAVIEGQPPADYRLTLMETIEAVHFNHGIDLEKFNGDTSSFVHTSKFLQTSLIKEKKEKKVRPPYILIVLLIILLSVAGYLLVQRIQRNSKYTEFASKLESIPGYHLTSYSIKSKSIIIKGLKDRLADDYSQIASDAGIEASEIKMHLESFISADSAIVIKRAQRALQPPAGVKLWFDKGVLYLSGTSSQEWQNAFEGKISSIYGIDGIDISELNQQKVDLKWIIPSIEKQRFLFEINVVSLDSQQQIQFDSLVKAAVNLDAYNQLYGKKLAIYVRSFTNRNGNIEANERVASKRAEEFMTLLEQAGVKKELLKGQVLFAEDLTESVYLRSVHFAVFDTKPTQE
ncbi:MAG: outer membrane protein/peptidoglycan-associated (lipo)protein [Bacteroidetes bacterium]|nr:MAG: outer membrane protein/peptidoglycan-associated (lipo)protein [Bacteroidota bacterium]